MDFSFIQDAFTYESRMVGRDLVKGLIVSTCHTSDMGYETAICDATGAHPVERYDDKEASIAGHIKWMALAETMESVVELGNENFGVEPERIVVKRMLRKPAKSRKRKI